MDYLEIVKKYKDEIVNSISKLIQIPSFYKEEEIKEETQPFGKDIKSALDYFLDLGNKENFLTKNIDNYCGYVEFGNKDKELLGILGHLDVVPATGNWKYPPFSGTIVDNKIYGRGAIDDKGPTILAFYALKIIKDLNIKLNKRVRIIVGLDEELHMRCLKHYLEKEEIPSIGFTPDADFPLIYGEKGIGSVNITGLDYSDISYFYAGERYNLVPDLCKVKLNIDLQKEFLEYLRNNSLTGEIKDDFYIIQGKSAHAMQPDKGINAAFLMVDFLKKYVNSKFIDYIDKYLSYDHFGKKLNISDYDEDLNYLTSNLGLFRLENNKFLIGINYRVPKIDSFTNIIKNIEKSIKPYDFKAELIESSNPHIVNKDSFLVKTLYEAYKKYSNDNINKPFTIGGGTYARCFKNNVAFGPSFLGDEDVVHQVNEYIDIDKALLTCAIYMEAIVKLCA